MDINNLASEIASDSFDDNLSKIDPVLLWFIVQLISISIQWFLKRYTNREVAESEFLKFYKNMNIIRKIQWSFRIRKLVRSYQNLGLDVGDSVNVTAYKLGALTTENIKSIFSQAQPKNNN